MHLFSILLLLSIHFPIENYFFINILFTQTTSSYTMGSSESGSSSSELKRSCEECSSSKVKCSQDKPVCKRCRKHSLECTYATPKRTGRPRKVPKDQEQPRPRVIRPLASAASRHSNFESSSSEADSPLSGCSLSQEMHTFDQHGRLAERCFPVDAAGDVTSATGVDAECHFPQYNWPTNAQDLEALWGTSFDQQPYMDSGFDGSNGQQLRGYDFTTDGCGFSQDTWKQQEKAPHLLDFQSDYMYLDFESNKSESGQFSTHGHSVDFSTW